MPHHAPAPGGDPPPNGEKMPPTSRPAGKEVKVRKAVKAQRVCLPFPSGMVWYGMVWWTCERTPLTLGLWLICFAGSFESCFASSSQAQVHSQARSQSPSGARNSILILDSDLERKADLKLQRNSPSSSFASASPSASARPTSSSSSTASSSFASRQRTQARLQAQAQLDPLPCPPSCPQPRLEAQAQVQLQARSPPPPHAPRSRPLISKLERKADLKLILRLYRLLFCVRILLLFRVLASKLDSNSIFKRNSLLNLKLILHIR
ncbi:hypothetical protein OPT61_g9617 [Boeremia exigua]|uniref:Uncharacterized protein n=1 Tax=Boeremia exigua TaxID=749465 RepID=A0ACC2HTG7_9PLEO|nr:hypothetical protein OPT61_g9617 [Boeremia exigua]